VRGGGQRDQERGNGDVTLHRRSCESKERRKHVVRHCNVRAQKSPNRASVRKAGPSRPAQLARHERVDLVELDNEDLSLSIAELCCHMLS
jgi:hypothetical protein